MRKIILIAGPSGAGKTTMSDYLTRRYQIPRVITHTTRPKRPGESDSAYYFETDESFARLHFFEHVSYGDYQYGSSREGLERAWEKSDLVSLIVDIKGARSYLDALGSQVYFLYVTCSLKELAKRMAARGDSLDQIKKRLEGSELNELPADLASRAHVLVNDDLESSLASLDKLVKKLLS
ncbi:guanylate kinase [Lactobacillus nasalidis]|uniref:Guanylate kinase n=1 Tax=Lactobacillus nasalidis TaxID=2797258 RepID=A0ABQ3W3U7_9LACO|nr:guanylate kinase [Lactobacillus nasalidis]GHV98973.1 guanylate kinase [Lactobacillus nasalidis]GHW00986.1 guanylate kinase [Lactobacillus nasalidis]